MYGASYGVDFAGNITSMPHLANIGWDERGRLGSADRVGGGVVYFVYDGEGARIRKVQTRVVSVWNASTSRSDSRRMCSW